MCSAEAAKVKNRQEAWLLLSLYILRFKRGKKPRKKDCKMTKRLTFFLLQNGTEEDGNKVQNELGLSEFLLE